MDVDLVFALRSWKAALNRELENVQDKHINPTLSTPTRPKEGTMKEISELNLPRDLKYSKEHEWARQSGDTVRVGITDFAQDQLGDIVFVELPEVGSVFSQNDECATIESVKAVSEVYIPISGEIAAINESLEQSPELVNQDPYGHGWLLDIKPSNPSELNGLMDQDAYVQLLQGEQ